MNKDIDEILATGKKKEFTYSKGLYTLQKSTFNASKYEKLPDVNDPDFWNKVMPYESIISISVLEKKFKKEKKEMGKNEKLLKDFVKDLEVVFNDFIDAKFDVRTSMASRKQLEADEEKLREMLKKMIKLNGLKLCYVEKCKEWLREMLRTNRRKKPMQAQNCMKQDDMLVDAVEEDDIIYDSDDPGQNLTSRSLRKRHPQLPVPKELSQRTGAKRGRKPKALKMMEEKQGEEDEDEDGGGEDEEDGLYGDEEEEEEKGADMSNGDLDMSDQQDDIDYEEDEEERYGLRGRRKR